jgi:diguanylate cyclase (GGDEF)-like protein/PAS domain S-box-containing protein
MGWNNTMTLPSHGVRDHTSVLDALVSSSPDHFYLYDRAGKHLYASPAAAQALGMKQSDFIGKTWQELGFPSEVTERFNIERENVFEHGTHWRGQMLFPTLLGKPNTSHDYVLSPVRDDDDVIEAVLVSARDNTERNRVEADWEYHALHDELTGLANRTLLSDRIEQSLLAAERSEGPLALLFVDLDQFKRINDTVGHQTGDLLLQQVALRWKGVLRASDTLSRLGGDEFVVLLPTAGSTGANETAIRMQTEIDREFEIEGTHLHLSASIGIAIHEGGHHEVGPGEGSRGEGGALMQQADEAMYRAKQQKHAERRRNLGTPP